HVEGADIGEVQHEFVHDEVTGGQVPGCDLVDIAVDDGQAKGLDDRTCFWFFFANGGQVSPDIGDAESGVDRFEIVTVEAKGRDIFQPVIGDHLGAVAGDRKRAGGNA